MRYVIDPPALLRIVADTGRTVAGHQLVAPNSIRSQALALLLDDVENDRLDEREALARHQRLTELKMRLLGDRVSRRTAWDLARADGGPRITQAEYVAVARLQADALVALDADLARAANGLVTLADFDDLFHA